MIYIKHIGLYVNDLKKMKEFYMACFDMKSIVSKENETSNMLDELLNKKKAIISTEKLITQYGEATGIGEMLELIKVENKQGTCSDKNKEIDNIGTIHISFGVDNMENVKKKICDLQGEIKTQTYILNGNKCCFAKDPEGNWLELISKSDK